MNKIITTIIILCIFYTSGSINSQYITSLKLNDIETDTVIKKYKEVKSPEFAGFLSLIVPGAALGHVYNEQPVKFAVHLGISFVCVFGFFSGFPISPGGRSSGSGTVSFMMVLSGIAFIVNWVWSVADAVSSAQEINRLATEKEKHSGINKKARLQKYRTSKSDKIKFGIGLDKYKNMNFQTVIYF